MVGGILKRRAQRGLTLVELLVVIVILALASAVVLLNAPPSRPAVREDAERFAARMELAMDEAIANGAVMRVSIDAAGYAFEALKGGEWTAFDGDRFLGRAAFDARSLAMVEIADAANDNARALGVEERESATDKDEDEGVRRIGLDPLGAQTPFALRFSSPDGVFVVTVDEAGAIAVKQDG